MGVGLLRSGVLGMIMISLAWHVDTKQPQHPVTATFIMTIMMN